MAELNDINSLNQSIDALRMEVLTLLYDDSRRAIDFDSETLRKVNKIRISIDTKVRTRSAGVKHRYSSKFLRGLLQRTNNRINTRVITHTKLEICTMVVGEKHTSFKMTPTWFKVDNEAEVLKTIIYPSGVVNKRPFNTVARYRAFIGKSNNFANQSLEIGDTQTETLVLALDAFARLFGGELSFTDEDLSFEESTHRNACGVANLSGAHLLTSNHAPTAKLTFEIDLAYKELSKSEETMQHFALSFVEAIVEVLGCECDYVRVLSIDESSKSTGQTEITFGITTPSQEKTQEYVRMLQLRPEDFDTLHNYDYRPSYVPEHLTRGGYPYYLPKGWYRHAIKIHGKYQDGDAWIGSADGPNEWPVAFHGTHSGAVSGITAQGLLINAVKVDLKRQEAIEQMGAAADRPGLYLATHCNGGSHSRYTQPFDVQTPSNTKTFRVVFQCRVRPGSFTTHTSPVNVGHAWRVVDPDAVRPYGILLKDEEIQVTPE